MNRTTAHTARKRRLRAAQRVRTRRAKRRQAVEKKSKPDPRAPSVPLRVHSPRPDDRLPWSRWTFSERLSRAGQFVAFANTRYAATCRPVEIRMGGLPVRAIRLGIQLADQSARHDWRELQRLKNELLGPDWTGIELFPSEAHRNDSSNYWLLWCWPPPNVGRPPLLATGMPYRDVADRGADGPPQRRFAAADPYGPDWTPDREPARAADGRLVGAAEVLHQLRAHGCISPDWQPGPITEFRP